MDKKYKALTLRVPKDKWKDFKILCIGMNISMNELLMNFIDKEIQKGEKNEKAKRLL